MTTLLVGKKTLKLENVRSILLEIVKVKKPTNNSEAGALVVKSDSKS